MADDLGYTLDTSDLERLAEIAEAYEGGRLIQRPVESAGADPARNTAYHGLVTTAITPAVYTSATITAAAWLSSTVTITTASPHGFLLGQLIKIAGMAPAAYNGTVTITGVPSATTFTFALAANPGTATGFGTASGLALGSGVAEIATFASDGRGTYQTLDAQVSETVYSFSTAGIAAGSYVRLTREAISGLLIAAEPPAIGIARTTGAVPTALRDRSEARSISAISWSGGTVTVTLTNAANFGAAPVAITSASILVLGGGLVQVTLNTAAPHNYSYGEIIRVTGFTPAAYNGDFQAILGSGWTTTTIQYLLPANPGAATVLGTVEPFTKLVTISGVTPPGYCGTYTPTYISATQFTYPLAANPGTATVLGTVEYDQDVAVLGVGQAEIFGVTQDGNGAWTLADQGTSISLYNPYQVDYPYAAAFAFGYAYSQNLNVYMPEIANVGAPVTMTVVRDPVSGVYTPLMFPDAAIAGGRFPVDGIFQSPASLGVSYSTDTLRGLVNTGLQDFAGVKRFDAVVIGNHTDWVFNLGPTVQLAVPFTTGPPTAIVTDQLLVYGTARGAGAVVGGSIVLSSYPAPPYPDSGFGTLAGSDTTANTYWFATRFGDSSHAVAQGGVIGATWISGGTRYATEVAFDAVLARLLLSGSSVVGGPVTYSINTTGSFLGLTVQNGAYGRLISPATPGQPVQLWYYSSPSVPLSTPTATYEAWVAGGIVVYGPLISGGSGTGSGSGGGGGGGGDCCAGACGSAGVPATLTATVTNKVGCATALPDVIHFACANFGVGEHYYVPTTMFFACGFDQTATDIGCAGTPGNEVPFIQIASMQAEANSGYTCNPYSAVFLAIDGAGNSCTVTVTSP